MRWTLVLFLIFGLGPLALAQESNLIFGDISVSDLSMQFYEKDSSAGAVILNDFFKVSEKPGDGFIIERHVRIKIFKESGFSLGDVTIPVYAYAQQFDLKAATHFVEDGEHVSVTLPQNAAVRKKINKSLSLYTFSFAQVRKGAILEYSYRFKSLRYAGWQYQSWVPVRRAEFWAAMPNIGFLHTHVQGNIDPTEYSMKETNLTELYHWVYEDVPGFKEESMITSSWDYIGRVSFSYLNSWEQLNSDLVNNKFFYDQISGNNFLKKFTESFTAGISDPLQKVDTLYKYVQKRYTRINSEPEVLDLKDTFEETAASSLEINMLLASMLNKIGFQSHIVLLSSRENGRINKDFPDRRQFDYAVCGVTVNDQFILLDASEKSLPLGYLPEQFVNGEGFIVSSKMGGWIPLNFFPSSKKNISAVLRVSETGTLTGTVDFTREGYDAVDARKAYAKSDEWTYIRNFINEKSWDFKRSIFQNTNRIDRPMKDSYDIVIDNVDNSASDIIRLSPVVTGALESNPFTDNERLYPITLPANREVIYLGTLTIPENYIIEQLPQSLVLKLRDGSMRFTFSVTHSGNIIQVYSGIKQGRSFFEPHEYSELKEFFSQVVAKQAEHIVLKKK